MTTTISKVLATAALSCALVGIAAAPSQADTTPSTSGSGTGSASGSAQLAAWPLGFIGFVLCYNDSVNGYVSPICQAFESITTGTANLAH